MPYRQSPNKMKKSPMEAGCGSPAKAKSPYMMYGKESGAMMSESPLAKYGCSKKYAKSPMKVEGDDKKIKAKKQDYGMTGYDASEFANPSTGEGLKVFKPQSRTVGGKTKYSYTKPSGEIQDITQEQYTKKLQSGGFKRTEKETIGGKG